MAFGTHLGGPNVAAYPGPTFWGVEEGSIGFVMVAGDTGEYVRHENASAMKFAFPGTWVAS